MELLAVREGLFVTISMGSNNDIGIAEISAFLAVLGIVIYALGLVGLCWPVYRKITHDASTALYAVSLMPKTVVAGQGVRTLFGYPILITVLLTILYIVTFVIARSYEQVVHDYGVWVARVGKFVIGFIAVVVWVFFIIRFLPPVLSAFEVSGGGGRWPARIATASSMVAGLVTGFLVLNTFFEQPEAILPRFPGWQPVLPVIAWIFVLNSVAAFVLAFTSEPALPKIALKGLTTAEGNLVAHVDGIWYVLDDNGKLVGIPDDTAGRVIIFPN